MPAASIFVWLMLILFVSGLQYLTRSFERFSDCFCILDSDFIFIPISENSLGLFFCVVENIDNKYSRFGY